MACEATLDGTGGPVPPAPSLSARPGGTSRLPVAWIGGTLEGITDRAVVVAEPSGATVTVTRLAADATAFYEPSGDTWREIEDPTTIGEGDEACVETLLEGSNLLALRVFVGAACGPS